MAHPGMPKPVAVSTTKTALLTALKKLDEDKVAVARVLAMETDFRKRISSHVEALPLEDALFTKFHTNPFVLLFHTLHKKYHHVSQIERDILPAKLFSSMETSAGRMVEQVVFPVYGWSYVPSEMSSSESVIDGKQRAEKVLRLCSLKSGPRTLNDEMSENIADAILANAPAWAKTEKMKEVDFTYGVLYGTRKQSNKKDWHILRHLADKVPKKDVVIRPEDKWYCTFKRDGVTVKVTVRIGTEWWNYLGASNQTFLEMTCAMIRACVTPSDTEPEDYKFAIRDLKEIISLDPVPDDYNVSVLQRSQWEWLFFFTRHFYDEFENR